MSASGSTLDRDEAFARIRLLRSPNIGPVSYRQLRRRFGSAAAALEALPDLASRAAAPYRPTPVERIEREIARVRACGARYLFDDAAEYPGLLAAIASAPPILICRGEAALLARPAVAIVGARNASAAAVKLAREFAAELARAGLAVVSGLARGIDAAAHRGALAGNGATVAVIASGIDVAYPPEHADLQEQIARDGVLLTEQPPGSEARGKNFPLRNRIIAGLAAGTVVVEAAPRSGSLITARYAGEAGREVMAIPGSPLDSRASGCNQLIRDGAILVQTADDVLEQLRGFDGAARFSLREAASGWAGEDETGHDEIADSADPADLTGLLGIAPVAIDELIRQSGQAAAAVQLALLELEIAGELVRHAGGRVSRAS